MKMHPQEGKAPIREMPFLHLCTGRRISVVSLSENTPKHVQYMYKNEQIHCRKKKKNLCTDKMSLGPQQEEKKNVFVQKMSLDQEKKSKRESPRPQ
jgi:hypothetical protein